MNEMEVIIIILMIACVVVVLWVDILVDYADNCGRRGKGRYRIRGIIHADSEGTRELYVIERRSFMWWKKLEMCHDKDFAVERLREIIIEQENID